MTTILAIDQGTSGTKAVVVDGAGAVLALHEVPVRPRMLPGGGVEHDPDAVLQSVIVAGREAVARARADIDIVSLVNQGETVLAWDPVNGAPLSEMIVWQDRRSASLCAEIAEYGEEIAARTGLVLDPYFSAPKQAWIRRNVTAKGVVTTADSWLLHRLTGEFVTDATTASRSLVTDLDTGAWDRGLLDRFGLGDEPLPRILGCDEVAGTTAAFGGDVAVGGLIVDQCRTLMQAVADVLRIPVEVYPSEHATPRGGVAMARCAVDRTLRLDDAVLPWESSRTYEPRWSDDRAESFAARWRTAADALR